MYIREHSQTYVTLVDDVHETDYLVYRGIVHKRGRGGMQEVQEPGSGYFMRYDGGRLAKTVKALWEPYADGEALEIRT